MKSSQLSLGSRSGHSQYITDQPPLNTGDSEEKRLPSTTHTSPLSIAQRLSVRDCVTSPRSERRQAQSPLDALKSPARTGSGSADSCTNSSIIPNPPNNVVFWIRTKDEGYSERR